MAASVAASVAVLEPFPSHFKSYHGPRRGFLDLPPELRDMIYHLTLIAHSFKSRLPTPIVLKNLPDWFETMGKRRFYRGDEFGLHPPEHLLEDIAIGILRVNKQIHFEAARYFYGRNEFVIPFGLHCHPYWFRCNKYRRREFLDITIDIPPHYLRMIRKCEVRVGLPPNKLRGSNHVYLNAKERLTRFADAIRGQEHSLHKIDVVLGGRFEPWRAQRSEVRKLQNVLEPLGIVHGIPEVTITGVEPEFMEKLKSALTGEKISCSPIQEVAYGTRTVKVKGRKRLQRYRLGRYYDSTYNWTTDCPATSDLNEGDKSEIFR